MFNGFHARESEEKGLQLARLGCSASGESTGRVQEKPTRRVGICASSFVEGFQAAYSRPNAAGTGACEGTVKRRDGGIRTRF